MDALGPFILTLAASPWIYALLLALVLADSLFPLIPSEAAIVSLAALGASAGAPDLRIILLTAFVGAVMGDAAAFGLGRWSRGHALPLPQPVARLMDWAHRGLARRPGLVLLTARFIPWARLAINLVAGREAWQARRLLPFWMIASALWALYNTAIGVLAAHWFEESPLLAMLVAILAAVLCGGLIDLSSPGARAGPARVRPDQQRCPLASNSTASWGLKRSASGDPSGRLWSPSSTTCQDAPEGRAMLTLVSLPSRSTSTTRPSSIAASVSCAKACGRMPSVSVSPGLGMPPASGTETPLRSAEDSVTRPSATASTGRWRSSSWASR